MLKRAPAVCILYVQLLLQVVPFYIVLNILVAKMLSMCTASYVHVCVCMHVYMCMYVRICAYICAQLK